MVAISTSNHVTLVRAHAGALVVETCTCPDLYGSGSESGLAATVHTRLVHRSLREGITGLKA